MADMGKYRIELGRRISELRRERGISQELLGQLIDKSRTYIGYLEQGVRTPSLDTLLDISEALGVRMPDIFDFEWPMIVEYRSHNLHGPKQ